MRVTFQLNVKNSIPVNNKVIIAIPRSHIVLPFQSPENSVVLYSISGSQSAQVEQPYQVLENSESFFTIMFSDSRCPCNAYTSLVYALDGGSNPNNTKPTSATSLNITVYTSDGYFIE